ncbi:MAG TPA: sensor histidine kinase, partial [Ruminiclostridium sp.]
KDEVAYLSREFNRMVVRINDLVDEAVEQKSRFSRQELKALQSQISPHFLYNTLEIVNWMARTRDVPEIVEIVKALSDMMRYITSHSEEIVTVEKELEYLKMYCLIQKYRYKDKFTVFYEVEDDILDFCLPKLTLQPIIENAIVHAFNGVRREGKIIITGNIVGDRVRLQIIDNGKGIDNAQIESMLKNENISSVPNHVGIGVSNVNQRIKLIYGNEFGLQIKSVLNEGTQFDIWIPIGG